MKIKRVLLLFSLVTVLVTSSVVAFASEEAKVESSKEYSKIVSMKKIEMKEKMEEHLSQALSEGKISQEEYDKILEGSLEGRKFGFDRRNLKGEKLELTEEQKAEIKEKMEEHLSQALSEGKISQEEYDKILDSSLEGKRFRFGNFNKEGIKELRFNKQKDKE